MSVVSVKRKWTLEDAVSSDVSEATEGYDVVLDSPVFAKFAALLAVDPNSGLSIPATGQPHPDQSTLIVKFKRAEALGPLHYEVEVRYDDDLAGTIDFDNPLNRPPDVRGGSLKTVEQIENDVNGNPILNTADEPPDPPISDVIHDMRIRITWNTLSHAPTLQRQFGNRTNADNFEGAQPGQLLCDEIDFEFVRESAGTPPMLFEYWRVTAVLDYREGIPVQGHDGTGGPARAWWKRFPNRGFREKVGTDGDGKPEYEEIVDANGEKITEPHLLAADGTKLDDADDAVFLEFQTKKMANFSAIGIPI